MWIFGYGSLMWDNWESSYGCSRKCIALLKGYRRTFNKASTQNRGTRKAPCPTLNLENDATGTCKGIAFELPDKWRGHPFAKEQHPQGWQAKTLDGPNLPMR